METKGYESPGWPIMPTALRLPVGASAVSPSARGDLQKAIALLEEGLILCQDGNFLLVLLQAASGLGYTYALSGQVAEALPLLEQAVEQATSMNVMLLHSLRVAWLSEAYLLAGRHDEAVEVAQRALHLSRDARERGHEAWTLRLLGEIHTQSDPPDAEQAEAFYQQAMALGHELEMRPLLAHCHFGLGTLYHRIGRVEQARGELSTAIEMFRGMEMTFWLTKAEAEFVQVEQP